jgi:hypothetical protein
MEAKQLSPLRTQILVRQVGILSPWNPFVFLSPNLVHLSPECLGPLKTFSNGFLLLFFSLLSTLQR